MNTDKTTKTASAPETRKYIDNEQEPGLRNYIETGRTIPAEKPAAIKTEQPYDVVKDTKAILAKHAPWIAKYLAPLATPKQEPRDLIADALRRAGYDIYASGSKATEIIRKEQNQ